MRELENHDAYVETRKSATAAAAMVITNTVPTPQFLPAPQHQHFVHRHILLIAVILLLSLALAVYYIDRRSALIFSDSVHLSKPPPCLGLRTGSKPIAGGHDVHDSHSNDHNAQENVLSIAPATHDMGCATQFQAAMQKAGQIALNVSGNTIYRFAPGSTQAPSIITVSIDSKSFKHLTIKEQLLLRHGLRCTLHTINLLRLGLEFVFVEGEQRGFIKLKCGGPGTWRSANGRVYKAWASTTFPDPLRAKYTVYIYAATFEMQYYPSLMNILCHEFAHLLGSENPFHTLDFVFLPYQVLCGGCVRGYQAKTRCLSAL